MDEITKELQTTEQLIARVQEQATAAVAKFEGELKTLQAKSAEYREAIKSAMEAQGVKKFENDYVVLTYVAPTVRTTIDSARLKAEAPDVYANFSKTSEVAGSLRIKVKEVL